MTLGRYSPASRKATAPGLVEERVRVISNLQTDLQAVCPGLLEITKNAGNQWFLNFLVSADTLPQLARLRAATLRKISAVGGKYAGLIEDWQKRAHFSEGGMGQRNGPGRRETVS